MLRNGFTITPSILWLGGQVLGINTGQCAYQKDTVRQGYGTFSF